MIKAKVLLAAITAPVTIAVLAFAAQGAQASTSACTRGAYSGYCGTQANNASTDLVLDSAGQKTTTNNKVIGWPNSTSDPGTDWVQLAFGGSAANGVMWIFAPNGVISNMCAADPGDNHIVLRACNGSNFQRWVCEPGQRADRVPDLDQSRHPQDPAVRGQGRTADHRYPAYDAHP